MSKLVIDIETIGEEYDKIDATTQEALSKWIKDTAKDEQEYENELEKIKDGMGLSPLTGEVVAIGVIDVEKDKGVVYYQSPANAKIVIDKSEDIEEDGIKLNAMTEKEMLESFWNGAKQYHQVITFNGRAFDIPFLMLRSAILGVRPSMNFMGYRYSNDTNHIDLYDHLTFYGASRKKGTLHLFCRAFGIPSPKEEGVTGDDVTRLFKEGKYLDIARYNIRDIRSTRELYLKWEKYLKF